jgi:hypothetical protein
MFAVVMQSWYLQLVRNDGAWFIQQFCDDGTAGMSWNSQALGFGCCMEAQ